MMLVIPECGLREVSEGGRHIGDSKAEGTDLCSSWMLGKRRLPIKHQHAAAAVGYKWQRRGWELNPHPNPPPVTCHPWELSVISHTLKGAKHKPGDTGEHWETLKTWGRRQSLRMWDSPAEQAGMVVFSPGRDGAQSLTLGTPSTVPTWHREKGKIQKRLVGCAWTEFTRIWLKFNIETETELNFVFLSLSQKPRVLHIWL